MTNVPIPGRSGGSSPHSARSQRKGSRRRFYIAVTLLAVAGIASVLLSIGEPWNLSPDLSGSITKSIVGVALVIVVVLPAFAVFRYDKASAGRAWHEPRWRPSMIGFAGLLMSMAMLMGWHGLRLAVLVAREWTRVFG